MSSIQKTVTENGNQQAISNVKELELVQFRRKTNQ